MNTVQSSFKNTMVIPSSKQFDSEFDKINSHESSDKRF